MSETIAELMTGISDIVPETRTTCLFLVDTYGYNQQTIEFLLDLLYWSTGLRSIEQMRDELGIND